MNQSTVNRPIIPSAIVSVDNASNSMPDATPVLHLVSTKMQNCMLYKWIWFSKIYSDRVIAIPSCISSTYYMIQTGVYTTHCIIRSHTVVFINKLLG